MPYPGVDIFDEKLKDATIIQTVIDDLLKSAHATIRGDPKSSDPESRDPESRDPERYVHESRHDAVPVYYLRPDTFEHTRLPEEITMAVHTSGYRDGYRFRIAQPSTKEFPNGYTYGKELFADQKPEKKFEDLELEEKEFEELKKKFIACKEKLAKLENSTDVNLKTELEKQCAEHLLTALVKTELEEDFTPRWEGAPTFITLAEC